MCIRRTCRLSGQLINGQCHGLITALGGFCLDIRLTAIFESPNVDIELLLSSDRNRIAFIREIWRYARLKMPYPKPLDNTHLMEVKDVSTIDGGKVGVYMQVAVFIEDLDSIDNAFSGAEAGLALNSHRATWNGVPYNTFLTPTTYKPMLADEKAMVMFYDAQPMPVWCHMLYAMAKIQTCEGVKIPAFKQINENLIQASGNTKS